MIKRISVIAISLIMLIMVLLLTSCSIEFRSNVEKAMDSFLTADNYSVTVTTDEGTHTYMVAPNGIYLYWDYDETETVEYMYTDGNGGYFYAKKWMSDDGEKIEKIALSKEEYAAMYMNEVYEGDVVGQVFAYRHILDMAEEIDGGYKYSQQGNIGSQAYRNVYTIVMENNDLVISQTYEGQSGRDECEIRIFSVGKTKLQIPDDIAACLTSAAE